MKKNLTEMVLILDRSGSMSGLESDTIGGFNAMLRKQKQEEGEALVSVVLFDDKCRVLYDRVPIEKVPAMTDRDYQVGGCTALLDALGGAVRHTATIHRYAREEDRPEKTVFVVMTDGMENASRRYTAQEVKRMVSHEQEKYGWEFLFLGANMDAIAAADSFGIRPERAVRYECDSAGTALNFECVSRAIGSIRSNRKMGSEWKQDIENDFKRRGNK